MKIAYLDCFSGAAGDMLVGACLDAGVEIADLRSALAALPLSSETGPEWSITAERVRRQSISGTRFVVGLAGADPAEAHGGDALSHETARGVQHRRLADVERIVAAAGFPPALERRMLRVFRGLAEAEARAHDTGVQEVHFHEVGAVDSIIDVCAAVLAFDRLGAERVFCSDVVLGTGLVRCAHGTMPVPAPGTIALLDGVPVRAGTLDGERCTPTGAALLRELVDEFRPPPTFRPVAVGYGAGARDEPPVPNLLRITVGEIDDPRGADAVWEIALQVDNTSGEVLGHALGAVLASGALDVWATPTITKKSRPAYWVVALADDAAREAVEACLLTELPTLGLRRQLVSRSTLPRRVEERATALGTVRFKVRTLPDGTELAHPEADDVERLARELGVPLPVVLARLGPGHGG